MAGGGPAQRVSPEDVLEVFRAREDSSEPLTAPEIAEALDCSRRTALDRLNDLEERGAVASKKVGARSRVWWRSTPADASDDDGWIDDDDPFFTAPTFTVDQPVDEREIDDVLYDEPEAESEGGE